MGTPLIHADRRQTGCYSAWLSLSSQIILGAVFVFFGTMKVLAGPGRTYAAASVIGWSSSGFNLSFARLLPFLEIAAGLWALTGVLQRASIACIGLSLVGFTIGLARMGERIGWSAACGCMGPFDRGTIVAAIVRNLLLLVLCGLVLRYPVTARSRQPPPH